MKKLLFVALLMLALVFTVVACEHTDQPDVTTDGETTVEPTVTTDEPDTTAEPVPPETQTPVTTQEPDTTKEPDTTVDDPPATQAPVTTTEPDTTAEPETEDPMAPVNVFEAADITTIVGGDPNNLTQDCVSLEGDYLHIVPIGADPYWYPFANVDGARYVAIRYRTDATDADIQMYIGSTGTAPSNDDSMLRQPVVADSEWHLAVFDTQSIIDKGLYNGSTVSYFRFDPLEAGYMLDENGEPYYIEGTQTFARYSLPEGCSIDVEYIAFFHSEEAAALYDFNRHKAPMWNADKAVVVHQNFDQFFLGDGTADDAAKNGLDLYHAVNLPNWDNVVTLTDNSVQTLSYWGWMALAAETVGTFGYQIDTNAPVYSADFTVTPEQPVVDAALQSGGKAGTRMLIRISIADLQGAHTIRVLYKDAEGNEVCLNEIALNMPTAAAYPDTTVNVTVNAADNFNAESAVDATVNITDSNLKELFPNATHAAGDQGVVVNGADGACFKAQGFSEAFMKMDGTYVYGMHSLKSGKKAMASFFIRGAQSVKPVDTTGIVNVLNNYFETDGQDSGHAGAGIQIWNHTRLFLGIKYYDENALTKIGTAYWLIEVDAKDTDVQIIDDGNMVYITVNGELIVTIELVGSGKTYEGLSVSGDATFCEKAIVTLYKELKPGTADEYGFHPDENGQCVIENTLIVDTPLSDVGVATRTGTLEFTNISIAPLSSVEIPQIPGTEDAEPEGPAPLDPSEVTYGDPAVMSVCADNVRSWVGDQCTDLCTQEAHLYLNNNDRTVVVDGLDYVSFRGWANPSGVTIAQFGYQINDGGLIFDDSFIIADQGLKDILGAGAERYENIKVPVADLTAGTYTVTLLAKDNDGVVYEMNGSWGGDIMLVKN